MIMLIMLIIIIMLILIGTETFKNCNNLQSVILSKSITEIPGYQCPINNIVIIIIIIIIIIIVIRWFLLEL